MRYLVIIFATTALFSCNKDKRYICWCYDNEDTVVQNNPFYAKGAEAAKDRCAITEDSLQQLNNINAPYCKVGGGER